MKLEKHVIERIEGLTNTNAIINFKESINTIIVDMLNEGWGYEDATDYMFDVIKATVEAHKRQDEEDEEFGNERASLARTHVIGKKVVIIDETQTQNNVSIKTISDFELEGMIWFEEDEYGTNFALESDIELFIQGKKAFIHPNEVSIQLIS
jgi:protease II